MICTSCGKETGAGGFVCSSCGKSPLLDGRYEVLEVLEEGESGSVLLAKRALLDEKLLIRRFIVPGADTYEDRRWFRQLTQELRMLSHAQLVTYTDEFVTHTEDGAAFHLVRRFVEGRPLDEEMTQREYSEADVLNVSRSLLGALEALHSRTPPVSHGSIHPRYIFRRTLDDQPVLGDLGVLRRAIELSGSFDAKALTTSPILQQTDSTPVDDLKAIGLTMLSLLSRQCPEPPWDFASAPDRLGAVETSPIVERLLAKSLGGEFKDAGEMKLAVEEALRELGRGAGTARHTGVGSASDFGLDDVGIDSAQKDHDRFGARPEHVFETTSASPREPARRERVEPPPIPAVEAEPAEPMPMPAPIRRPARRARSTEPPPAERIRPAAKKRRTALAVFVMINAMLIAGVAGVFVFMTTSKSGGRGEGIELESPIVVSPFGREGHVCDDGATCEQDECDVSDIPTAPEHGICQALGFQRALYVEWGGGEGEDDEPMPHAMNWVCRDYQCGPSGYDMSQDNCSEYEMLDTITCLGPRTEPATAPPMETTRTDLSPGVARFENPIVTNPFGATGHVCDDGGSCSNAECEVSTLPHAPEHGICQALGFQRALRVTWGYGPGDYDSEMPHAYNWSCRNYVCRPGNSYSQDNCSDSEMLASITCSSNLAATPERPAGVGFPPKGAMNKRRDSG